MDLQSSKLDFHFFICTNTKEKGGDCSSKGSVQLLEDLKAWSRSQPFAKRIRINKAGCLGRCEEGVVAVAYPSNEWIVNARTQDLEAMKEFILKRVSSVE